MLITILVTLGIFTGDKAAALSTVIMKSYRDTIAPTFKTTKLGDKGYQKTVKIDEVGVREDEHFKGRYFLEIDKYYPMEGPYHYAYLRYPAYYVFPLGSKVELKIDTLEYTSIPYTLTYGRIPIFEGEPSSASIPSGKYLTGKINYPTTPVKIVDQFERDGALVVEVEEYVTLCNSYGKNVRVVSNLSYSLNATKPINKEELLDRVQKSWGLDSYMPQLEKMLLQSREISDKPKSK